MFHELIKPFVMSNKDYSEWHDHFAIFPVIAKKGDDVGIVWLKNVKRRLIKIETGIEPALLSWQFIDLDEQEKDDWS